MGIKSFFRGVGSVLSICPPKKRKRPPLKLSKEWYERMAEAEDKGEIGIGHWLAGYEPKPFDQPCLFDHLKPGEVACLSCSCPKCSVKC